MAASRRRTKVPADLRVGEWTIQGLLTSACIEGRGPAFDCGGTCCRHGVYVSLPERDRILEHAARIQSIMDGSQTREVGAWFEDEIHEDDDFEGGWCIGTDLHEEKCVFLNLEGLCTLQVLEPDLALPRGQRLKPFYCRLFPLTTWGDRVEFDDLCDGVRPCCTLLERGDRSALEAYAWEFTDVLGEQGYRTLRHEVERRGVRGARGRRSARTV